ncbi:imelysin family protein [Sulfitobacter donghicola]|uniref:Peptidase n=1 Tax=Sulfitobacter donghicola DSW-25 = KCTC 12864 = JCM 14565 TaxID=1300350 RepID=A0A073IED1_9RHOB|nr:imelysin family protein [Sulfitobacter donghicola]KEJ88718.1 peptidase [Sulfitobacter donghicola DSW-25 = KCTC 12864 = JCM 14565]KIN68495.1 Insulin-cleaving metalloproteinase outer membrane protein [Sulfitobacter donghicola DSW-25 = KCTC 12864 = JCM 14565]
MKKTLLSFCSIAALSTAAQAADEAAVVSHYGDIALAGYEDSLTTAKSLKAAVDAFVSAPTEENLAAAKTAWLAARVPYQQTEAFRFGNPSVDEWEGKVNAWPLDEGLIDYVDPTFGGNDENPYSLANIVAHPTVEVSGQTLDATKITPAVLQQLHEFDGIEANVATGYHAIEFLLWGQDLNGTDAGAGKRPASDFDVENCTAENCDRRADYLVAATELLIADLEDAIALWVEGGQARQDLVAGDGIVMAFTGIGSLSYGEQAGERMKLGLLLHDPEEEHDCFSDNTHNSHYYDGLGIRNVYTGRYVRTDGSVIEGPSLYDYVAERDQGLADNLLADMDATMKSLDAIRASADAGQAYDQLLASGNDEGNALIQKAIDGLVAQTRNIERAVEVAGLEGVTVEGSDSLDNTAAVFE